MSEKKILFDLLQAQPLLGSKFHGGGEYIKSVYHYFVSFYKKKCLIVVFYNPDLFIDDWILGSFKRDCIKVLPAKNNEDVQKILDDVAPDVFFSGMPYLYGTLNIPAQTHFCGTIHGLRSVELPSDQYAYKYFNTIRSLKERIKSKCIKKMRTRAIAFYKRSIDNLDSVVCVSNHTKYAIKNFFPKLEKPIICCYTPQKLTVECRIEPSDVECKFVLLIACNRFEKNSYRAIVALDDLFDKGFLGEYKVVTVGTLPAKIKKDIRNVHKFVQYDYVSSVELERLYAECDFFLYPTLNEGFGMPPLEAMKYGKTCVVSGVCSLPEVCGDAVYYTNPYDISEMQNRILMASENKISEKIICDHLQKISAKQYADLAKLCDCIADFTKKGSV